MIFEEKDIKHVPDATPRRHAILRKGADRYEWLGDGPLTREQALQRIRELAPGEVVLADETSETEGLRRVSTVTARQPTMGELVRPLLGQTITVPFGKMR
jgi:hypothetical protein